jgi:hypothetical protein
MHILAVRLRNCASSGRAYHCWRAPSSGGTSIHVGIRRNRYLRGCMYAFIELFAPHLKRTLVEKAIAESAAGRNKNQAVGCQTLPRAA